jgi:mono/diheme cytochrome c family protein
MAKFARFNVPLVATLFMVGTMGFAQSSGEAIYKSKCTNCHGATGLSDTAMARTLKVKPVTDPSVKNMGLAEMIEVREMEWARCSLTKAP